MDFKIIKQILNLVNYVVLSHWIKMRFFGHMAGKVVDDFENMTFMYVLNIDNRYFFSRNVIITPEDVHTSNDAKRYF